MTEKTQKLLNCPFCGLEDKLLDERTVKPSFVFIRCPRCGMSGPRGLSLDQAVSWWNMISRECRHGSGAECDA